LKARFFIRIKAHLIRILLSCMPKKLSVSIQYRWVYNRKLNFDNPQTLSEKLNVIKLRTQTYSKIVCSNKVSVKDYLYDKGYSDYLIPTIDIADSFHKIKFKFYELPFVVKLSNGSGQQLVVRNSNIFKKSLFYFYIKSRFRHYAPSKEIVYSMSKRQFIIEPYLTNNREPLMDYKVYCFNGHPKFIQINESSEIGNRRMMLDERLEYYAYPFASGTESFIKLPDKSLLISMLRISSELSNEFDFVRIDFYIINNKVKIGELTFYPMGGYVLRNSIELDNLWGFFLSID
jgi:hypothetical protein